MHHLRRSQQAQVEKRLVVFIYLLFTHKACTKYKFNYVKPIETPLLFYKNTMDRLEGYGPSVINLTSLDGASLLVRIPYFRDVRHCDSNYLA